MNNCKNCVYWINDGNNQENSVGLGKCNAAIEFWDATTWSDDGEMEILEEFNETKLFVQDGSSYAAALFTKPDFFCTSYKAHQ